MTMTTSSCPSRRFNRNALWLALLATPLASAETVSLEPIQVTAERQSGADAVVSRQTLDNFQAEDLADVFAGQPDVSVGGPVGVGEKVYVRGFEDSMLNVSVDGAVQAGALFHHAGRLRIEPELIKQVEVDAGAGRATSGSGAVGGAIKFVTKDPEDLLRSGETAGALVKLGSFSNTDGYKASTTLFGRLDDRWSAMFSASQSDHDEYQDGDGNDIAGTKARQQLGYAKLVGHLPGDQTVRVSHEIRTDDGDRNLRPQWGASPFNKTFALDSRRDTTTLNYGFTPSGNPLVAVDATVYYTDSEIERDPENRDGRNYRGAVRSVGGDLRNTSRFGDHSLTYGVEYREDKGQARGEGEFYQESGEVFGTYLQADIWLTRALLLSTGVRYDDYAMKDTRKQSFSDDGVSPNVNLSWEVLSGLTLNAGYAEAFRGPVTHDTFKLYGAENDPELKGERGVNTELGFDYVNGTFSLSGEVYRSDVRDAISDPLIPWKQTIYTNVGDLETEGFLISTGYRWQGLSAGLSFHSNEAEVNGTPLTVYEHNLLGNSIGDTWVADLAYQLNPQLEFGWQGRFVQGIDRLETSVGTIAKPGYGVHDLYAHWLPTGSEDLRLTLTVKNVADKQYLDHASQADFQHIEDYEGIVGNMAPGRDIRLGLALRF